MAQVNSLEVHCGLCGSASKHEIPKAASSREAPDLDTRPGEPLRSTIKHWMQTCPECGYVAADISSVHEDASDFIATQDYQRQRFDSTTPDVARPFLCHALILNHVKQYADAGWTALHAAWASDDANDEAAARKARELAIHYWKHGKRHGQAFGDLTGDEFALAADVLRRAGHFEEALVTCTEGIGLEELDPVIEHVLLFEKTLIQRRDSSRYSLATVPGLN
jgi:hypothetical protein